MGVKEFFKPDWKKVILFVIFLILASFYVERCSLGQRMGGTKEPCQERHGLPLSWYRCFPVEFLTETGHLVLERLYCDFLYLGLIMNLAFWYLISCLTIFVYDRSRGKK